jgi:hypothetical protein
VNVGDTVTLLDKTGASVGVFYVEEKKPQAILGSFKAGTDYVRFRATFEEFASRVNAVSLAYIDEIHDQIAAFGIHGVINDQPVQIFDLQIFEDGASFRLAPFVPKKEESN